jgi:hypothetical protein
VAAAAYGTIISKKTSPNPVHYKTQCLILNKNQMEPEIALFLRRFATSIFTGILWMMINSTAGIMFDNAFIHESISLGNILFYIWLLASIPLMIWFYKRLWKNTPSEE